MSKEPNMDMSLEELQAISDGEESTDTPVEADTEVETLETEDQTTDSDDTDTIPETPNYDEMFKNAGLDKQYKGGIPELLSRIPETNRYLREVQEERNRLQKQNEEYSRFLMERNKPDYEVEPDDFQDRLYTDPVNALKEKGFVDKATLEATNNRLGEIESNMMYGRAANIIGQYDDLKDISKSYNNQEVPLRGKNAIWDTMMDLLETDYQFMADTPLAGKLKVLFPLAKDMVTKSSKPKPPVKPLSTDQKNVAKTTSFGGSNGSNSQPDFGKMSADELLLYAKNNDKID